MPDNIILSQAEFSTIAADTIGGVKHVRVKLGYGPDGSFQDVGPDFPLPTGAKSRPPLFHFADTVGDGSGLIDAIGDYSSGALGLTEFAFAPAAGEVFKIARLIVTIEDAGTFDSAAYGNGITLTNGISIHKRTGVPNGSSTLIQDLTAADPVHTNTEWGSYCYDVALHDFGAGNPVLLVRWTFSKSGGDVELDGDAAEYLSIRCSDDMSALVGHEFQLQGFQANG